METSESLSGIGSRAALDPIAGVLQRALAAASGYAERFGEPFISIAAGPPDTGLLPAELYLRLTADVLEAGAGFTGQGHLNYTMPQGFPPLRAAFAGLLGRHGVRTTGADLLITSGGMEALSLAAWLVLDPGDVVVTEGPGFPGALTAFELCGAGVVQVDCGEEGIAPDAVADAIAAHRPKLVSLMPDFQNPTGARMPVPARRRIAELLRDTGTYALEDGAYSLLGFADAARGAVPPLQHFAPDHVFHAASLSKVLAPAVRIGALVAPPGLAGRAAAAKSAFNMQASAIHQAVAERFVDPAAGHVEDALATLRSVYHRRRDLMLAALAQEFPAPSGFTWTRPDGGMFLWLSGPADFDFTVLFDEALDNGVAYVPGSRFYTGANARHNSARLNFASTPDGHIAEAIRRLANTIRGS